MTRNALSSEPLAARINDAERRLLARHRSVRKQGTMLGHSIRERLTSPALLGSAVGVGILLGKRTRGPDSGPSWLRMAMSAMPWMHTLLTTAKPSAPTQAPSSSEFPD